MVNIKQIVEWNEQQKANAQRELKRSSAEKANTLREDIARYERNIKSLQSS